MTTDLLRAVNELVIGAEEGDGGCIDDRLTSQRPKARSQRDPEALKRKLESDFLTPPTSFGPEWLNRLQQYVIKMEAMSFG